MKVLVTGFPGTGKSAVAHYLKQHGYTAYDPEEMRGYMHLESRLTGRHTHMPQHSLRGWFDNYGAFNWDINRVHSLLGSSETVFICSLADNMATLLSEFDKIFVLRLDDFELEMRLQARGKFIDTNPELLADTMTLHRHFEESLINQGAQAVSSHPNTSVVVGRIIEALRY